MQTSDVQFEDGDRATLGSLFSAAARLFRAQPWNIIPEGAGVCALAIPELGIDDGVVSIMGGSGERRGFMVFESRADFAAHLEAVLAMLESGASELVGAAPHAFVEYFDASDLEPRAARAIAAAGYEIASPKAYPSFGVERSGAAPRTPDARERAVLQSVSLALAAIVGRASSVRSLLAKLDAGESVTFSEDGVALTVPHPNLAAEDAPASEREDDALDLYAEFLRSPEAASASGADWAMRFLNEAEERYRAPVGSLDPATVRRVLLEAFPRDVSCRPSAAAAIVGDLRAFFAFVARTRDDARARECAAALDRELCASLERALADRSKWGPTKTRLMDGLISIEG